MIGRTISHYRILSPLGEGGMGVVYVAEDTRLGRHVAVKLPLSLADDGIFHSRFLREARAISALSHPHIAAVYDYGETDEGQPFIVMELVIGQSLSELLHASALTIPRAVEITMDVAEALEEAHSHGVVHRDIKPSNVLINERGQVKVLDFGLAKQLDGNGDFTLDPDAQTRISTRTRSDVIVGTPLYLSPEQARGGTVDGRSDLFALGALLYECIAGRPAFSGANVIEIGGQVLHVDPPPPSTFNPRIPLELDRITLKALAKKPEERYQSAAEMHADLGAVLGDLSESDTTRTRRITPRHVAGARSSALMTLSEGLRRPRLSPAAFLIALALALLAVWGVSRWRKPALHEPPPQAVAWYERGVNFQRDGAYDQASRAFEKAIEIDDEYALAHASLAEAWMELDYGDRANAALLRAKSLVPDSSALPKLQALYLDGITYTALRKFPQAVEAYEEIAKLKPDEPKVYVDLGRAYERNDEPQKAINSYLEAIKRDGRYATAYLRLGILHGRQGQMPDALNAFRQADSLYEAMSNVEGRTEVLYQRGFFYNSAGKFSEARQDLQRALEMARATNNQYQRIQVLLVLSSVFLRDNKQFKEAEAFAREAVELAQSDGMYNLHARGLLDLGNVFVARGDYAEGERYFRQALDLAQKNQVRRAQARANLSLAGVLMQQFKPNDALDYAGKALDYYRGGNFRTEAVQTYTIIGRAYRQKGDYAKALETFEQQLLEATKINSRTLMMMSHVDIGRVLVVQEKYPEALEHFKESYAINMRENNKRALGYSLMNQSTVLERLGRFDEEGVQLDQAIKIAEEVYKALHADLYTVRAQLALGQRKFSEAQKMADQALIVNAAQSPEIAFDAHLVRCLAQAFNGSPREAKNSCDEAELIVERTGDPWLRSRWLLALAEVLMLSGDYEGALARSLDARDSFKRHEQPASEWRALLVAARASRQMKDDAKARSYATQARDLLARLEQRWGGGNYRSYLTRPDVEFSHRQLEELPAADN